MSWFYMFIYSSISSMSNHDMYIYIYIYIPISKVSLRRTCFSSVKLFNSLVITYRIN